MSLNCSQVITDHDLASDPDIKDDALIDLSWLILSRVHSETLILHLQLPLLLHPHHLRWQSYKRCHGRPWLQDDRVGNRHQASTNPD